MMRTILQYLSTRFPRASRQTLKRMVQNRRVLLDGKIVRRLDQQCTETSVILVRDTPVELFRERSIPNVVFEDDDLLVVNKPAGLLTSTVPREKRPTLLAQVRRYVAGRQPRAPVGLIHRLDRDACGLLIFSKSDLAYRSLKTQFFHHTVGRTYAAIVRGVLTPPQGRIASRLVERADGTVYSTSAARGGESAVTHYQTVGAAKEGSRLLVKLETGRKHQIRVHLSERGHPIVGDRIYGRAKEDGPLRLCAIELAIDHPRTGKRMTFQIKPPFSMDDKS